MFSSSSEQDGCLLLRRRKQLSSRTNNCPYLPENLGLQEMLNKMRLMSDACMSLLPISCTARTTPAETTSACVASFDTRPHKRRRM